MPPEPMRRRSSNRLASVSPAEIMRGSVYGLLRAPRVSSIPLRRSGSPDGRLPLSAAATREERREHEYENSAATRAPTGIATTTCRRAAVAIAVRVGTVGVQRDVALRPLGVVGTVVRAHADEVVRV